MKVLVSALSSAAFVLAGEAAWAQECLYQEELSSCGDLGCIVNVRNPRPGQAGTCGPCTRDAECGGTKCDLESHRCEGEKADLIVPEPWYPSYHLAVVDAAFDFSHAQEFDLATTFGAGYWFRGAFRKVSVVAAADGGGGWESPDPPRWFFHAGGSAAVVSSAQNLFAELSLFHYTPAGVLATTGYSLGALYQRQGTSIWKLSDDRENSNRVGPALGLEFMHNLTLRVSYALPLNGPMEHGSVLVSLVYMKSLLSDLVPAPYRAYLPSYL